MISIIDRCEQKYLLSEQKFQDFMHKMVDKMEKEILPKRKKFDDEDWNLYIGSDIEKMPLIYEGKEGRK